MCCALYLGLATDDAAAVATDVVEIVIVLWIPPQCVRKLFLLLKGKSKITHLRFTILHVTVMLVHVHYMHDARIVYMTQSARSFRGTRTLVANSQFFVLSLPSSDIRNCREFMCREYCIFLFSIILEPIEN